VWRPWLHSHRGMTWQSRHSRRAITRKACHSHRGMTRQSRHSHTKPHTQISQPLRPVAPNFAAPVENHHPFSCDDKESAGLAAFSAEMDGVSSASSVLQIVETAFDVYLALYRYFKLVKDAPKHSKALRDEASLLSQALKTLHCRIPDGPPSRMEALSSAGKRMTDAISELNSLLAEIDGRMNVSKTDVYGRLKWPFTAHETESYLEKFHRYNDYFNTILNAFQLYRLAVNSMLKSPGQS
jgi:hypothetical protein